MERETQSTNLGGISVHATLEGHSRIDFDKRAIKKTLRKAGGDIRKAARRLVARRATSSPGDFPGRDTGALLRSIKLKMSSGGFWAKVEPQKTPEMKSFYPAFLFYGTKRGVAKRGNYMIAALDAQRENVRGQIRDALKHSLVPR